MSTYPQRASTPRSHADESRQRFETRATCVEIKSPAPHAIDATLVSTQRATAWIVLCTGTPRSSSLR